MTFSQILVFALTADAAWVACGLARKKNRWPWIVTYWILLTAKNFCDIAKI